MLLKADSEHLNVFLLLYYYILLLLFYYYYSIMLGGELQMSFQDVAFLPSQASFCTTFHKIVAELKSSGPPHVLKLWLVASMGMLPVECFLCQSNFMEIIRHLQR